MQLYVLPSGEQEVIPGIFLVRATRDEGPDDDDIKKGDWGLVRSNSPDFVWSQTPEKDPEFGLSEEEINAQTKEQIQKNREWDQKREDFSDLLDELDIRSSWEYILKLVGN